MDKILYTAQHSYLQSLRPRPDKLLAEMEQFAAEKRIPILDWKAAELLEMLVQIHKPKRVLEIGTAIAYSSIRIARRLGKNGIVDTIEKSRDNIKLANNFIRKAGLRSKINLIEGDALSIMPSMRRKYDLIFLDADKQDYAELFYYSLPLLRKGGICFVDNLLWHGFAAALKVPLKFKSSTKIIREFNKLFLSEEKLNSTLLPVGDGVGIGIKL